MADIRINSLPSTATSFNTDDYIAIDGASGGTRKMLAATLPLTDVTLGGTSGPSVKSSLSARAPRQGLVFDGTAGATVSVPAFGTSDFSISWFGTVTSLAAVRGLADSSASLSIAVLADGSIRIYDRGSASNVTISAAGAIVAGKAFHLVYVRGQLYLNGVALGSSFPDTLNYSSGITKIGESAFGYWLGTLGCTVYNRALSASEVVSLYEAGAPAGADYNSASNTSLITGDNSTFASDTGYWTKSSATISGGNLNLSSDGSSIFRANLLVIGKKYRYVTSISANTTSVLIGSGSGAGYGTVTTTGTITGEFTATSTTFVIYQSGAGAATVGDITLFSLGLLLAPDAAQAGGGLVWYDTSGNAANISWTSGVSWNVPSSRVLGGNWTTSGTLGVNKVAGGEASVASTLQITSPAVSETGAGGLEWKADVANNGYGFRTLPVFNGVSSYDLYTQSRSNSASWTTRMSLTNSGNLLIGTTTDLGQKLQVGGDSGFLGHLEIPANKHIYMKQSNPLRWSSDGLSTGSVRADVYADSGGALYLRTNGSNTALTLDSSQNATFAGTGQQSFNGIIQVAKTAAGANSNLIDLYNKGTTNNTSSGIAFSANNASSAQRTSAEIRGIMTVTTAGSEESELWFSTRGAGVASGTAALKIANTGNATFAGSIAIGNTVQTAAGVASTHKVTISIGGSTYYLLATNV